MRVSRILINNHGRAVPVVHQAAGGRRDTNTECQREFVGVLNVTFDESLTNDKIGNTQVSLIRLPTSLHIMFKIHSTSSCHNIYLRDGPRLCGSAMGALVRVFPSAIHSSMVPGTPFF